VENSRDNHVLKNTNRKMVVEKVASGNGGIAGLKRKDAKSLKE